MIILLWSIKLDIITNEIKHQPELYAKFSWDFNQHLINFMYNNKTNNNDIKIASLKLKMVTAWNLNTFQKKYWKSLDKSNWNTPFNGQNFDICEKKVWTKQAVNKRYNRMQQYRHINQTKFKKSVRYITRVHFARLVNLSVHVMHTLTNVHVISQGLSVHERKPR